jgi:hypothetical protein
MGIVGNVTTNPNGTLTGSVTAPGLPPVPFTRTDSLSDSTTGFGDLYPQFTMRWNAGANNYMT